MAAGPPCALRPSDASDDPGGPARLARALLRRRRLARVRRRAAETTTDDAAGVLNAGCDE